MDCEHSPHDDPRYRTSCIKCGQIVFAQRQRPLEDLLHRNARLPERLLRVVHARTESGPYPDHLRLADWRLEAVEELADAVNYLTWLMQSSRGSEYARAQRALVLVGKAFAALDDVPTR